MYEIVIYFLMVQKLSNLQLRILKLRPLHYVYEPFQEKTSVNNIKKTDLSGYVYGLSVCYDTIAVDDILNIHKYSMEMNNII